MSNIIDVTNVQSVHPKITKPIYLVTLRKGRMGELFLSLDKPIILNNFIEVKGFFVTEKESVVKENYIELVQKVDKAKMMDMLFPIHRVNSVQNLIFRAK